MKNLLFVVIFLPLLLTGSTFCWVLSGERRLVKAMDVALPQLGEPTSSTDAKIRMGQEMFNAKGCVFCHGPNGAGGVKNNNAQGGLIPSLTKVSEGYTAEELKTKILTGVRWVAQEDAAGPVPPLNMPAWKGHITEEELDAVVAFLTSMAPPKAAGDDF